MSHWDGIDEFVAVANAGSFAAAARQLGASTSHISRAVAKMEGRLQTQLFYRTTRSVKLTATGLVLVEQCRRITRERDETFAMIGEGGEPQGDLRITCSITLGERFVAPIIRRFALTYPGVNVTLELSNRLLDLVAEGFDLAIRTGNLSESRLVGTRIASRRFYTCASPAYIAEHGEPKTIADLARHQCLIGSASTWHFQIAREDQAFKPKGRFRCNNGEVIVNAALDGMGICQLPEFYVVKYLTEGRLGVVLDQFRVNDEPIWAVYPHQRHLLPKVRNLVALLRSDLPAALKLSRPLAATK